MLDEVSLERLLSNICQLVYRRIKGGLIVPILPDTPTFRRSFMLYKLSVIAYACQSLKTVPFSDPCK